ncbi:hypothetical protein [Arthrobacter sp. UYCu511]
MRVAAVQDTGTVPVLEDGTVALVGGWSVPNETGSLVPAPAAL